MKEDQIQPGSRVGEYVLTERLGGGGFASVWKAHHHVWSDKVVAIKIPTDQGLIEQLRHEARIQRLLEKLDDAHIVRTIGLDTTSDPPYFVMEYVEGESLRAVLNKKELRDLAVVVDWSSQILKALDHAHAAGVVHRDLKPENVMVTKSGVLKLMDFGLGRLKKPVNDAVLLSGSLEEPGEGLSGTIEYAAPEVLKGEEPGPAADIYSFGVILFELLTNERPQPGDKPSDLNPVVPARLDLVFSRCYARIDKRFRSADEVLSAIRRLDAKDTKAIVIDPGRSLRRAKGAPPAGMALVKAGQFTFGSDSDGADCAPSQTRYLDDFWIDLLPVTNTDFQRFVKDGGYTDRSLWAEGFDAIETLLDSTGKQGPRFWEYGAPPPGRDSHPVTGVSFAEAAAYAAWAGKRLPSEEEWEKAARGQSDNPFPFGKKFDKRLCNTQENGYGTTTPAGKYRKGASHCGALDMAGNVLEWTSAFFAAYPGNTAQNPYFGEFYRALRGGAWYFNADAAKVWVRHFMRPELRLDYVGFRCARGQ